MESSSASASDAKPFVPASRGDPMRSSICAACQKVAEKAGSIPACSRCHAVRYCNRECQRSDWLRHKSYCNNEAKKLLDLNKSFSKSAIASSSDPDQNPVLNEEVFDRFMLLHMNSINWTAQQLLFAFSSRKSLLNTHALEITFDSIPNPEGNPAKGLVCRTARPKKFDSFKGDYKSEIDHVRGELARQDAKSKWSDARGVAIVVLVCEHVHSVHQVVAHGEEDGEEPEMDPLEMLKMRTEFGIILKVEFTPRTQVCKRWELGEMVRGPVSGSGPGSKKKKGAVDGDGWEWTPLTIQTFYLAVGWATKEGKLRDGLAMNPVFTLWADDTWGAVLEYMHQHKSVLPKQLQNSLKNFPLGPGGPLNPKSKRR